MRALAFRAMQIAVAAVLLVLVWRSVDGAGALRTLLSAHLGWLLAAAALLLAHTVFAALRWRVTAAPLGIELTRALAVGEYFLGQLVNLSLPGGVVGDAGRAARSRRDNGLGAAAGAVVVERAVGQLALLAVFGAAFVVTLSVPGGIVWPLGLALAVGAGLVLVLGTVVLIALRARDADAGADAGDRMARVVAGLRRSVAAPGVARAQAGLSTATTLCILGAFACCAAAIGAALTPAAVLAVVPLVLLAMLLPITVGGWGTREGAAVAVLPIAGVAPADALATSVAFGVVGLAASLPGVAALWTRRQARTPGADRDDLAPDADAPASRPARPVHSRPEADLVKETP